MQNAQTQSSPLHEGLFSGPLATAAATTRTSGAMHGLVMSGLLVLALGCIDDDEGSATAAICPSNNTLTYDSFGEDFMASYCTRCHSSEREGSARNDAPSEHDFDTLAGVLSSADEIDEHAAAGPEAVNTFMPPNGDTPSEEERRRLGQWLACELRSDDGGSP